MDNSFLLQTQFLHKQNFGDNNQGLLNGNIGIAIFLYHVSRVIQNSGTEEMADNLLDKIFASLATTAPSDFGNGLAGIGWGIEYLVQNGFAECNTDEILDEVDTKVYKTLCDENLNSFELTNGLTGYLVYLNARLRNNCDPQAMACRINKELLIHTINKLDEIVTSQFPSIVKEMCFNLFWQFPLVLYALTESYQLGIYNQKISQMIKQWIMYFEAYIPSLHINRIFMALALNRVNTFYPNKRIEKQVQILLFATNFEEIAFEFDPNNNGIHYGWPGAIWILYMAKTQLPSDSINYSLIIKTYNEYLMRFKPKLDAIKTLNIDSAPLSNYGISEGVSGIGLMELLWPDVFGVRDSFS
jgi:lantibiotic modifying enzyme